MKKGVKMVDMSIHDVSGVVGWCLGAYSEVENSGLESSSGDSERPFLRSSFCKGLYYSFVEHFSASSTESQNVVGPIMALPRSQRSAFQSAKNKENL